MSDLIEEDMLEFRRIVIALEMGTRAAFNPTLFNWMFLMNNAKRDGQEPHVHAHMVPRYAAPVDLNGRTFTDDAYPRQYNTGHDKPYFPNYEELAAITRAIQRSIA